ncbi:MAG: O-antigen/teichoic acid export membrane protein, partial [Cellvibrionaceae bacterium]
MSVVFKQTFLSSISAYIGIVIGYVNIILIMPLFLSEDQIGLIRTINSIAMLLVPLALVGASGALVRFFPKMPNEKAKLLGLTASMVLIAFGLVVGLSIIFKEQWFAFFQKESPEVNNYFALVYAMLAVMIIFNYLEAISRAGFNISVPNFFREVVFKAGHLIAVLFVGFGWISYHQYLHSHLLIYVFLILGLGYFVKRKVTLKFSFTGIFQHKLSQDIIQFSLFSILGSFGIMMVLQIDQIMVSSYLGLSENGIYSTALFMAVVIELPRRLISQITTPVIAKAYHEERFNDINNDYKSVSNSLFFLGGFLFLMITLNLHNIYQIMPNGEVYAKGYWVVYFIGLTKIVDMVFSVNGEIV